MQPTDLSPVLHSQQLPSLLSTRIESRVRSKGVKIRPTLRDQFSTVADKLVRTLRRHLDAFDAGIDGHLLVTRTGKAGVPLAPPYCNPLSLGTAYRVWHKARAAVLPPDLVNSPLARRPYDLRHACLSTWLNAGVPAAQVAEWAGHSVNVLLRVYAKCLDGQEEMAKKRIGAAIPVTRDD